MKNHLFNNHTWPDFTCLPNDLTPVLKLVEVPAGGALHRRRSDGPGGAGVSHVVPTTGFIVEDTQGALAFSSDTGPTRPLLGGGERSVKHLRAVDHGDARSPTSCRTWPTSRAT